MIDQSLIGAFIVAVLVGAVRLATPLLFAAVGQLFTHRSGVINLGVDGIMLTGAVVSFTVAYATGNLILALASGMAVGALWGLLMAFMSVHLNVNQIVAGVGLGIAGTGLANYIFRMTYPRVSPTITGFENINIPVLSQIPVVGQILFQQNILTYVAILLVPISAIILFKTTIGLKIRTVGENPQAADTAGINVKTIRYLCIILGAVLAGVAGAYLPLAYVRTYTEAITAGRGWIAIAIVIFGNWNPYGVFAGSLLFGLVDATQLRLQAIGIGIPYEFLVMQPYVLSIIALTLAVKRESIPAALGRPYKKG